MSNIGKFVSTVSGGSLNLSNSNGLIDMLDEMDIHGAKTALKLSNLSQVEKEFVALNSKHGDELFDFAKGLSATSDISSSLSKNIDKLKSGFKGTWNVIKSFVSAHKVGVGIGAAVAIGTAIYTGYKMYKEHLIDTANAATEAWDNSLSNIQSKIQQYQELKIKLDSGDLSQSETIEVKQQILDLQNQIVASYGDQILSRCVNEPTIQEFKIKNRSSGFNYPRYNHPTQRQIPAKITQLLPVKIKE